MSDSSDYDERVTPCVGMVMVRTLLLPWLLLPALQMAEAARENRLLNLQKLEYENFENDIRYSPFVHNQTLS